MSDTNQTWKKYVQETAGKKKTAYENLTRVNMRSVGFTDLAKGVFISYLHDDKREEYLKKDSKMSWYQAISPAKLFNPALLVNNIANFAEASLAKAIDSIFPKNASKDHANRSHPIAKKIKRGVLSPLAAVSITTAPVANIQRAPVISNNFSKKKPVSTHAKLYTSLDCEPQSALTTAVRNLQTVENPLYEKSTMKEFVMPKQIREEVAVDVAPNNRPGMRP